MQERWVDTCDDGVQTVNMLVTSSLVSLMEDHIHPHRFLAEHLKDMLAVVASYPESTIQMISCTVLSG